ncbi:MAG TPA: glycoside hydrolase family 88 protein, partial [Verrucomicrobiae bacterium]|nr:glycoside hydrolase family 88 protein [Verrucomicrobiae bacterium]
MKLHTTILVLIIAGGALPVCGQASWPTASAVDEAMRRANNYWIASNSLGNAGWARGAYNTGNHRTFRVLGERSYHDREVSWGDLNQWKIGPEGSGSADAYTCGQSYIDLYRMDLQQPLYLADIKSNTDVLVASPAVDGWSWIDAFYMQAPVLARLGNLTGDTNYFNKLWLMYDDMKTRRGLFDGSASLWYRDGNYTNALDSNGQKIFWSRGNGWVFAGLARVLQQMTTNTPHYYDYVMMFTNMAPALKSIQGADGMWRSSLYDYNLYPNPETSGTGLFTYGLAWGVRNGLLPAADYTNTIQLAWQGLTNLALHANGLVGWVQDVGAAPAPTTATTTTDFGVGAFLLACSEIYLMAPEAPSIRPWAGPDRTVIATNGSLATIPLDASQTEIYKGAALSYTWWEATTNLASGVTASTTLGLGSHVITLKVLGSDSVTYTDSMTVAVMSAQVPANFVTLVNDGAWTWFNDPRALFQNGILYFGYNRAADGKVVLSALNLQSGNVTNLWAGVFTQTDDHDVPGLLAKQDGRLLAIYARHLSDQFFAYRLSTVTNPVSSADWGAEQRISNSGDGMTYANPFQLSAESGKIYNFCRNLNYNPTVYTSTDAGATWSSPQILIQTGTGSTRPYVKYSSDYTNRLDFLYTDGHPREVVNNSLYHLYYHNGAFYKTDGTFVKNYSSLPILHDSGERGSVVYQYSTAAQSDPNQWIPGGRSWCWEIAAQTNGDPACVFSVMLTNAAGPTQGTDDRIYYYYARWTGTNWQKRFIAQAGRPLYATENDYAGGICLDPQDPNLVYISSDASDPFDLSSTTNVPLRAHYELWRGLTSDGGLTFTWTPVTTNSSVDNLRPYIPRRNDGEPCLLWFRGTYSSYTSF